MKRVLTMAVFAACAASLISCGGMPGVGGGGGGGGGGYKPDKCFNNQYSGDLTGAKTGQWMTYAAEASGNKSSQTVKVVGDGWVEYWMDMGSMAYGYLFQIGGDKKIAKAWAAAKGDKSWTEIKVEAPPTGGASGDKPKIKESDEKKSVKAGDFNCHRMDVTVTVQGKDYQSTAWYSKDVWKLYMGSEHGGLVATEGSGSKMWLDAKGEDGKPTMDLPK